MNSKGINTTDLFFKIETQFYLSKDLESALIVLINALGSSTSNKDYIGAVEVIRHTLESHSCGLEEILKDIKENNNSIIEGDI